MSRLPLHLQQTHRASCVTVQNAGLKHTTQGDYRLWGSFSGGFIIYWPHFPNLSKDSHLFFGFFFVHKRAWSDPQGPSDARGFAETQVRFNPSIRPMFAMRQAWLAQTFISFSTEKSVWFAAIGHDRNTEGALSRQSRKQKMLQNRFLDQKKKNKSTGVFQWPLPQNEFVFFFFVCFVCRSRSEVMLRSGLVRNIFARLVDAVYHDLIRHQNELIITW